MAFTHLHVHTQYSLLDGASRITELVDKAKSLDMTAIAITDHGVLYGVIDFYKACKNAGIKWRLMLPRNPWNPERDCESMPTSYCLPRTMSAITI